VVGKVAVFRSQKRLWLWIDTAVEILKECPDTHFLLVGDGEWRERILQQIQDSGKADHFHWVGVQKKVIPYLSLMDIYLSTSEFEGLPIAMLEAMSCEVPVVATRAGGSDTAWLSGIPHRYRQMGRLGWALRALTQKSRTS
jgi:glycosyltransferase involved in cell wall biosynthesis